VTQDDESLNNKLCTYTITQKEFMNQHWYHCHTCKMVDGVGVCTVCARVCHRDHDLSYAKYGSFFCDCGAKEDNRCLVSGLCLAASVLYFGSDKAIFNQFRGISYFLSLEHSVDILFPAVIAACRSKLQGSSSNIYCGIAVSTFTFSCGQSLFIFIFCVTCVVL